MKAYTSLEQSQKLAEILPIKSADMCWTSFDEKWDAYLGAPNPDAIKKEIPCWSLTALLDVLPKNLDIGRPVLATNYRGYYWVSYFDEYMKEKFTSKIYNNPVDACYKMVLKLNELNLLRL